ncbi:MAG: class I SAM-dependent methyltransferase [Anaerotignaceae bacterium]
MTHKFDVNNRSKLDNPKRREMLPVDKVLTEIGLKEDDILADIGCGIGYFSIPAAQLIGAKGTVYALDVKKEMIDELEKKADENNLDNIRTVVTDEYNLKLADKSVSFAFICTVLHEIEDRNKFLNETKRILNNSGKIAVVEWIKKESDWGPPVSHRVDSSDIEQELKNCGFKEISYVELNQYFYIVMGTL